MNFYINIDDYFIMFTGVLTLMMTVWIFKKGIGLFTND